MTLDEILEYMLSGVPEEYDISAGSFFYDLLYPVAEQVRLLREKIAELSDNSFALTAAGEYLDRKTAEQGLERRSATYAKGTVRISGNRGEVVPQGAKLAADNVLFSVDEAASIPEAGYVDLPATCIMQGAIGNVKSGAINRFPVTLPGLTAVTNTSDFAGGYDAEDDENLLERYIEKVSRPNASGNMYHYIGWAKEVEGVGEVRVIPLWNGPGTVKVVVVDSENQPASPELVQKVKERIEANRPIGASVTVVSATALNINVTADLALAGELDVQEAVEAVLKAYFADEALKQGYVSYAQVGRWILDVPGVDDYSGLKINNGTENITIPDGSAPVLGTVTLT